MKRIIGALGFLSVISGCEIGINVNGSVSGLDGSCVEERVEGRRQRTVCVNPPGTKPPESESQLSGQWAGKGGSLEVLQIKTTPYECIQAPCGAPPNPPNDIIMLRVGCSFGSLEGPIYLNQSTFEASGEVVKLGRVYVKGEIRRDEMYLSVQALQTGAVTYLRLYRNARIGDACSVEPVEPVVLTEADAGREVHLKVGQAVRVEFSGQAQATIVELNTEILDYAPYRDEMMPPEYPRPQQFRFIARKAGVTALKFQIQYPWICDAPDGMVCPMAMPAPRVVEFHIIVSNSGSNTGSGRVTR